MVVMTHKIYLNIFFCVFVVLLVRAYCLVMLMVLLFGIFSRMKELVKHK